MPRKPKRRRYDATARRAAAEESKSAILDAALRLFLSDGYAATTVNAIAKAAGVSVETIYKGFGGKPGLVRAIRDRGLAGAGRVHAERRSDSMQATETDPRRMINEWAKLASEVSPRVSPILLLIRDAAATDPEMAALRADLDDERLVRMAKNAGSLERLGIASSRSRARDILWLATSPELYELLVMRRGWSVAEYSEWLGQMLGTLL